MKIWKWTGILALPFHEKRFSRFWNVFFLFCLPRFFINPSPVAFKNYALCLFVQMNVNSYDTRFQIKWQFIEFRKYAHHNIFKSKILVIDKNIFVVHLLWLKPLHKCQFCLCLYMIHTLDAISNDLLVLQKLFLNSGLAWTNCRNR